VPRIRTRASYLTCWILVLSGGSAALAVPPCETLLPDTTRGFLSAPDVKTLQDHFNRTQLGQLVKDPVMKPFTEDLRRQFNERWSSVHERLGLVLEDMKGVPGGEAAVGVIQPGPNQAALIVLCDVTGHRAQAKELIDKVTANLTKQGAKKQTVQVAGTPILVFDLPKQPNKDVDRPQQQSIWALKGDLLAASDHLPTIEGVLARTSGKGAGSLGDLPAFKAVMKRLKADAGKAAPQARWFIQPLGYLEVTRTVRGERTHRKGKSWVDVFKSQGFTALQGIGGFVDFDVDGYQLIHRTAIWAPPPREFSMKILSLPNHKEFGPQPWVPNNVAGYSTLYFDVVNAFDNLGPLFDDLVGQGDTGVWQEVLEGLKKDPNGPRIDLRSELVVHLGKRVSIMSDYQVPITTTSERLLFAIETKDEKAVAAALDKMFKNDKEMRQRLFQNRVVWESVPEEKAEVQVITLDLPGLKPEEEGKAPPAQNRANSLLPNSAVTVANGHLLIASHYDFLVKVLTRVNPQATLARSVEYQVVQKSLARFGVTEKAAQTFGRTDEQVRPTYELIRQGKMPESDTMLGRVLNTLFGAAKKGVPRKQEVDPQKMPDYEFVRRFLGPAGMHAVSEPDGWVLKGFMLPK
jgi:hypothetical protein